MCNVYCSGNYWHACVHGQPWRRSALSRCLLFCVLFIISSVRCACHQVKAGFGLCDLTYNTQSVSQSYHYDTSTVNDDLSFSTSSRRLSLLLLFFVIIIICLFMIIIYYIVVALLLIEWLLNLIILPCYLLLFVWRHPANLMCIAWLPSPFSVLLISIKFCAVPRHFLRLFLKLLIINLLICSFYAGTLLLVSSVSLPFH